MVYADRRSELAISRCSFATLPHRYFQCSVMCGSVARPTFLAASMRCSFSTLPHRYPHKALRALSHACYWSRLPKCVDFWRQSPTFPENLQTNDLRFEVPWMTPALRQDAFRSWIQPPICRRLFSHAV